MDLSVADFAKASGISRQRALAMIRSGRITARKVGRAWVINQRELGNRPVTGRPLSSRMAWLLIDTLSGHPLDQLDPSDRFHVRKYLDRLHNSEKPAEVLHGWLGSRQQRVIDVAANLSDLKDIASDGRAVASGISDPRAAMSSAHEFEGYIADTNAQKFLSENLLVPSGSPNVRLHVVDKIPLDPVPLGLVIADLADWNRPREDGRVVELLKTI